MYYKLLKDKGVLYIQCVYINKNAKNRDITQIVHIVFPRFAPVNHLNTPQI